MSYKSNAFQTIPNHKIGTPPKTVFLDYFSEFLKFFHEIHGEYSKLCCEIPT